ncbi:hypothetical protein NN3_03220 [Nocardia neocaledoniensis NBRC 108232]|uniref:Uncharacterized protein n=1 Tax=Nocardia neocaledoniensis TaxID=236511 RepID=A0A317NNJ3_9NOCA|nr:hypothetical protein [Nocardia neocaledoniensis]PWV76557.1 hypothetical protein DFR69_104670 [Nocardia neocaledoniensis]GEM29315.1 hypothetical protein NN3_03220 [Nocardia neocaledoniensis NBRC 108232]
MTGPNTQPPGDGVPPSDPTVQWWERPSADATPAQADPTVLRGDIGGGYTAPPAQYPSTSVPYQQVNPYAQAGGTPPPNYYAQPQPQPQPYAAMPPQQQWGAPPRPPSSGNKVVWWIVGGSIAVVAVLILGLVVLVNSTEDDPNPFGPDSSEWAGDYAFKDGINACDLVDLTVLNQWSTTRETTTHTERGPSEYIGGGSYDCDAKNKESGRSGNEASLSLEVEFKSSGTGESDYARWKGYDTKTTGKGYENGPVTGLGSEAYYAIEQQTYSSLPNDYSYIVAAHDSNISVKVELDVSKMGSFERAAMQTVCENQVRKVLAALKK